MISYTLVNAVLTSMKIMTDEEIKSAETICKAVCSEFSKKLRKLEYNSEDAVLSACAAMVYFKFVVAQGLKSDNYTSFKAGDIKVTQSYSARLESATIYRDDALLSAAPYLKDVDFVFRMVNV